MCLSICMCKDLFRVEEIKLFKKGEMTVEDNV